jgi:hypothetical protein
MRPTTIAFIIVATVITFLATSCVEPLPINISVKGKYGKYGYTPGEGIAIEVLEQK